MRRFLLRVVPEHRGGRAHLRRHSRGETWVRRAAYPESSPDVTRMAQKEHACAAKALALPLADHEALPQQLGTASVAHLGDPATAFLDLASLSPSAPARLVFGHGQLH